MPLPLEIREQMARSRDESSRVADRERRRDMLVTTLQCLGWSAAGIFCIMWSAHTTDTTWGRAAFYGGLGAGNAGTIFTLLAAYRRGEKRGDW